VVLGTLVLTSGAPLQLPVEDMAGMVAIPAPERDGELPADPDLQTPTA
jgi:hypothetical protein